MSNEFTEALLSLDMVLDEENGRLSAIGYDPLLAGLVDAKMRLVGIIEAESVRLKHGGPDWATALDDTETARMTAAIEAILTKLTLNEHLLQRRIALCDDLLGAITAEAKRVSGGRSLVYGARGALTQAEQPTPISINSSL